MREEEEEELMLKAEKRLYLGPSLSLYGLTLKGLVATAAHAANPPRVAESLRRLEIHFGA